MFVNQNGVYGVVGSSVQKLSADMDGIFKLVDFTQMPQGALADINAIHNAVFLVGVTDPVVLVTRSIILTFDGKKWFVMAQGNSLTAFATSASLPTGQLFVVWQLGAGCDSVIGRADSASDIQDSNLAVPPRQCGAAQAAHRRRVFLCTGWFHGSKRHCSQWRNWRNTGTQLFVSSQPGLPRWELY